MYILEWPKNTTAVWRTPKLRTLVNKVTQGTET